MDLKDLIAPRHRGSGLSCRNCRHLMTEYDTETRGKGVWVCNQNSERSTSRAFPYKTDMPCFELAFSLSIYAQGLSGSDASYEEALSRFSESLAQFDREPVNPPCGFTGEIERLDKLETNAFNKTC